MAIERNWRKRINIDAGILGGKPVIKGTRVAVEVIVGGLAGGMAIDEVCDEFTLTEADVRAALMYATEVLALEKVHALPSR